MKRQKIGILGGTFNPIHNGHLIIAESAYDEFELDQVLIMPSGISYLKDQAEILPGKIRAELVELAIAGNEHFALSTLELDRPGKTFTYETILNLKAIYPDAELYFILGADSLFYIEKWKNPELIFKNCAIIVANRDEYTQKDLEKKCHELMEHYGALIFITSIPKFHVSSHEIRNRLKENKTIRYLLPDPVISHIYNNHLYQ